MFATVRPESCKETEQLAFTDESRGSDILLLSALSKTYEVWSNFSDSWQRVLDAEPAIKHFHMREARGLQGQFKGWTPLQRDLKIISLTDVIMRHEPHVLSCWVNVGEHDEMIRSAGTSDLSHAYHLCFHAIVTTVARYQSQRGITTPTDYIFDEMGDIGHKLAGVPNVSCFRDAQTIYKTLKRAHKKRNKESTRSGSSG